MLTAIKTTLQTQGCDNTLRAFDNHALIQQAQQASPNARRLLLNQFFNIQLLKAPNDTRAERQCLIQDGTDAEWLAYFQSRVVYKLKEIDAL